METKIIAGKKPWARGEKALLWVIVSIALCSIGGYLWWDSLSAIPTVTVPTPAMPSPNAFTYFVTAGGSVVNGNQIGSAISPLPKNSPITAADHPYTLSQKAALVAQNVAALRLLRQGLSLPYQSPPARSFSAVFPYYAPERGLARLLLLEAEVKSAQGDDGGAMGASLDAVQEGAMIPHGGSLIGMLVGIACQAIGRRQAWGLVDHLSAAQALAAERRLERVESRRIPYADVLQEEEWGTQAGLMEIFRRPDWATSFIAMSGEQIATGTGLTMARLWYGLTPKRTIMSHYTAYMNRSIADARRPYALKLPPPPMPSDPVNAVLLPVFEGGRLKDVDNETENALLMVSLALRAYKLEHGAYPAALSALVPRYLSRVPDDPFALSGPLRYKLSGSKYVLYSVGPDGKDDGGRPIYDPSKPAPGAGRTDQRYAVQQGSTGDIVAGVNLF